ncbi:hypothetical protein NM688_g7754 [Phlebia brevispora]|uniref:Uncharacterized protein n=1 Tax=Phlebia brevispora TaxID=194682 RepID=A0ACC1S211_9APHY|nr:hypothetical protein NM688_g7754 [Phlebia brevispora]
MTSAAGRKKSIISTVAPSIDLPVANNTLLNKAASQSTSLYQQCSALRARLMRVQDFAQFFSLSTSQDASSSRRSTDPVTQLWDCFALGVPLCYLFNLIPSVQPLDVDVDINSFDPNNEKTRKRAIAHFTMGLKSIEGCGTFMVTDLWDRDSNDGFVKVRLPDYQASPMSLTCSNKVVNIVTAVVDLLPEDVFVEAEPSSPSMFSPKDSSDSLPDMPGAPQEYPGSNVVMELVFTERKYVQDLETMQQYATALAQTNTIDQDTIHLLFPGLNKLLNFQRRFLIRLESIYELPWSERQWGAPFTEFEEEFAVYEPYCANYTTASEIMLQEEHHLTARDDILNVKSELPAFLIKPVQRICKYPLLLESLVKVLTGKDEYPYLDELKAGVAAAKRITDKINEAQRKAENLATVKNLEGRVEDWKGHHISNFGQLLLDDIFTVTKSEMDREYHVFLFEKIILCCKEYIPAGPNSKKVGKSNSILKKPNTPTPFGASGAAAARKKNTPLLLKGRIFLNNVTSAVPKNAGGQYSLAVYWKGDDDLEYFTLRCRNEEQLRLWETQLNRLIKEAAARRTSESRNLRIQHLPPNSTSPAPSGRQTPFGSGYDRTFSTSSIHGAFPPHPYSTRGGRYPMSVMSDDQASSVSSQGPQGYPPYDTLDGESTDVRSWYTIGWPEAESA